MMGVLEINIDQLPKILFSAMLVHIASKKLEMFHVEGPRQQFWFCTGFITLQYHTRETFHVARDNRLMPAFLLPARSSLDAEVKVS